MLKRLKLNKWKLFKEFLITQLKGQAVKLALKKLLGSAIMGGPKAWLIQYVVTELFEEVGEPLIRAALNQIGYYYDKIDGGIQIKKLEKAKKGNDEQAYNRAVDNILS